MKSLVILFSIICLILISSCKDDTNGPPPPPTEFSLKITVKDTLGRPVPNLRILGGSMLSLPNPISPDLRFWAARVWWARLVAKDSMTNSILFRDSVLMVFGEVDHANSTSWFGYTSASGELTLSDANRFFGLRSFGDIPFRDESNNLLGSFRILDTAIFWIQDTLTNKRQEERRVIRNGTNLIDIVWKPTSPSQTKQHQENGEIASILATTGIEISVASRSRVNLSVLQADGSLLSTLTDRIMGDSVYTFDWHIDSGGPFVGRPVTSSAKMAKLLIGWKLNQYPNPFN